MHVTLVIRGLRPQIKILDNEFSKLLLDFMENDDVDLQLVPEHINRKNAAEREIRTWKNHLLVGISSFYDRFSINLWDRILYQADTTLNILLPTRTNTIL